VKKCIVLFFATMMLNFVSCGKVKINEDEPEPPTQTPFEVNDWDTIKTDITINEDENLQ